LFPPFSKITFLVILNLFEFATTHKCWYLLKTQKHFQHYLSWKKKVKLTCKTTYKQLSKCIFNILHSRDIFLWCLLWLMEGGQKYWSLTTTC
jgi:hypothetical protein